ncbi:HIT family protein [Streptomyces sp. NPDC097619]|uniref:HIT family protein n=1 Tax=Streptomyces sp. NPDC097619 TaxID=3157228 RepID=UPI00332B37A9
MTGTAPTDGAPTDPTAPDCYTCAQEARYPELPPRERIALDAHWRVAHAVGTALPGWVVLVPRRHVTAVHELTDAEAAALGHWQVRLSRALRAETGCAKTYVVQFAEAEGFSHVHFHLVPRMPDQPAEYRGPAVFGLLRRPAEERVTDVAADALAGRLGARLAADGPAAPGGAAGQSSGS